MTQDTRDLGLAARRGKIAGVADVDAPPMLRSVAPATGAPLGAVAIAAPTTRERRRSVVIAIAQ